MNSQDEDIPLIFRESTKPHQQTAARMTWRRMSEGRNVKPSPLLPHRNPLNRVSNSSYAFNISNWPVSRLPETRGHVTPSGLLIGLYPSGMWRV